MNDYPYSRIILDIVELSQELRQQGMPVEDSGLFMLAWYLYHCDYQRP